MKPELLLELAFLFGAALVLLAGKAETLAAMIVRLSFVTVLCAAAIVVWALTRYWA